jgi:hypothetical protein
VKNTIPSGWGGKVQPVHEQRVVDDGIIWKSRAAAVITVLILGFPSKNRW